MKQLKRFLDLLGKKGFSCRCNFQVKTNFGFIENYLIQKDSFYKGIIFIIYKNGGFEIFKPVEKNDFEDIIKELI